MSIDTTGKPLYLNIDKILDAAEEYILGDDGQKAMQLLDNLPSYYIDNYPLRAYEIKKAFYKKLWTTADYLKDEFENKWDEENALNHYRMSVQWRGEYVKQIVKVHNDSNTPIHIVEVGASNHWLPVGMRADGLKFTYQSLGPAIHSLALAKENLKDIWAEDVQSSTVFVCMEVIEHCFSPSDIFHYYCKLNHECEYMVLTTPRYMLGGGRPDWRSRPEMAHVRTWGSGELQEWAKKTFPLHSFYAHDREHLVIRGFMKKLEAVANSSNVVKTVDQKEA